MVCLEDSARYVTASVPITDSWLEMPIHMFFIPRYACFQTCWACVMYSYVCTMLHVIHVIQVFALCCMLIMLFMYYSCYSCVCSMLHVIHVFALCCMQRLIEHGPLFALLLYERFLNCSWIIIALGRLQIKRTLLSLLSDEAYNSVQSFHSDSAVSFAVFLHHLGCISDIRTQQPPDVLLQAMEVIDAPQAICTIALPSSLHLFRRLWQNKLHCRSNCQWH